MADSGVADIGGLGFPKYLCPETFGYLGMNEILCLFNHFVRQNMLDKPVFSQLGKLDKC